MVPAILLLARLAVAAQLDLSVSERAWAAAHPAIRVAHPLQGPFALLDERGELVGLDIDYLATISARTGLRFENVPVVNATAGIDGVRERRFDAVMGIGRSPAREEVLLFGEPYAYSPDAIVSRSDSPFLFDIRQLGGKRVALARSSGSSGVLGRFQSEVPDARLTIYATAEEAIQAVARSEADVAYTDASVAAFLVKQRALTHLRVGGIFNATPDMYVGVRRDWPELVTLVDDGLRSMSAAERTQIINRWMVLDYESDRRWQRAFQVAAIVLAFALVAAVALVVFNRRMNRELAIRRRIQAELEQTSERLTRASAEKSELMRMIAHDLRSPLSALRGNTDFLLHEIGPDATDAREALGDMRGSIDRMRTLVGGLTDLHGLESGERAWKWASSTPERSSARPRWPPATPRRRKGSRSRRASTASSPVSSPIARSSARSWTTSSPTP